MDKKQLRQLIPIIKKIGLFNGLTVDEVAGLLDLHRDTVKKDWRVARAFLNRELTEGETQ